MGMPNTWSFGPFRFNGPFGPGIMGASGGTRMLPNGGVMWQSSSFSRSGFGPFGGMGM